MFLFIFDLHKVEPFLERQLLKLLMFLDGAAQFTLIVTGVCLVSDCQCFHMRIPAKNMLFSLYETKKPQTIWVKSWKVTFIVSFVVKTAAVTEQAQRLCPYIL